MINGKNIDIETAIASAIAVTIALFILLAELIK
jgi:hypothetical protein